MPHLLYPLDHEKQFLSAVIRSEGTILAECPQINEYDFGDTNRPVFRAIKQCIATNGTINRYTLVAAIEALNIKLGGAIEPADYVNALVDLHEVNKKAAIDIANQIKKWTVRRELHYIGKEIAKCTENDDARKATELIAQITDIFHKKINLLGGVENEPKDIYSSMDKFIHEENPYEYRSITTPFKLYNDMYGYLDPKSVYVFVARMKVGKSTFGLSLLQQVAKQEKGNFRALILDTEMTLERAQARAISSVTGINEFYITHKWYNKSPEMLAKVEKANEYFKPIWNTIDHHFIGGVDLDVQLSDARRWAFKNIKDGKKGAIMLDYIKLNSSTDFNSDKSLSMSIGAKMDAYKNLAIELNLPLIMFCQANRENEDSKQGGKMQNSSVIAGSDYIGQFGANVYLLEKMTLDQKVDLNLTNPHVATHSLKVIAPRQLGPNEYRQDGWVKYMDRHGKDRYVDNFLLYSFDNFCVSEFGSFRDAVENAALIKNVQPPTPTPPDQKVI